MVSKTELCVIVSMIKLCVVYGLVVHFSNDVLTYE